MKLYFNKTSPYARKVRVAVLELALNRACELIEIDPWTEPQGLLDVNPLSKVPALLLADGRLVTESDCIVRHLSALARDQRLFGTDEAARQDSDSRAALAQGLIDASFISVIEGRRPAERQWPDWIARQERAIVRTLRFIETKVALPPQRFDAGDIGLACALGYLDFRLQRLAWREGNPELAAWFAQAAQRASMLATQP